ncbi:autotransporter beta-domain protein, partial [Chlamydia psittaci C19/98]
MAQILNANSATIVPDTP